MLAAAPALAQGAHDTPSPAAPPPANPTVATEAAQRFPQPVRVGDLEDRLVIDPSEQQRALGRVDHVVRGPDGMVEIVVRYGGILGLGSREIAVPVGATALLGRFVQIVDLDRKQLEALPTWSGSDATVPPDAQIRVGINRN